MKTYRDLVVWQKAMLLVTDTYKITKEFPKEEIYGIVSQIRRCSISIPSNIAEGYGRNSTKDYIRFLKIAISSLYEYQTQIEISNNLCFASKEKISKLYNQSKEIERMLSSLINKLNQF